MKMTQTAIEINGKLHFCQILDDETCWKLYILSYVKTNISQMKIFEEIIFLLIIIYRFIKFYVIVIDSP